VRIVNYLFLGFIILVGVTFALLNAKGVDLNYYFGTIHIPLSLLLIESFALGILITSIVNLVVYIKLKRKNISLRDQIKTLQTQLNIQRH
jgi:lipopolysaccharide assembly protein A